MPWGRSLLRNDEESREIGCSESRGIFCDVLEQSAQPQPKICSGNTIYIHLSEINFQHAALLYII